MLFDYLSWYLKLEWWVKEMNWRWCGVEVLKGGQRKQQWPFFNGQAVEVALGCHPYG